MHKILAVISLLICSLAFGSHTTAQGSSGLLPPAEEFRFMLREDLHSKLPLGPGCSVEMLLTLSCSAFIVTLENKSDHIVRISEASCSEPGPGIVFSIKPPGYTGAWLTISRPSGPVCYPPKWANIRLKPGEKTEYTTRIISPTRETDDVSIGVFALRAEWPLSGCIEAPDGTDCLAPLRATPPGIRVPPIYFQEPVTVVSNQVLAGSPGFPDLGDLNLALEVTGVPSDSAKSETGPDCYGAPSKTLIDCAAFHYAIRNLGSRPVQISTNICEGSIPATEYRVEGGSEWKSLRWRRMVICTLNSQTKTLIFASNAIEGNINLRDYDTSPLQASGEYRLRFSFTTDGCIASPDGRFCLTRPENQPTITSKELTVRVQVTSAKPVQPWSIPHTLPGPRPQDPVTRLSNSDR